MRGPALVCINGLVERFSETFSQSDLGGGKLRRFVANSRKLSKFPTEKLGKSWWRASSFGEEEERLHKCTQGGGGGGKIKGWGKTGIKTVQ